MHSGLVLAGRAARWALRRYRDHFLIVFGLSMIAAMQRFLVIRYDDRIPGAAALASEVVTAAARVLLVVLLLRILVAEPAIRRLTAAERWQALGAAMGRRGGDLAVQVLVLAVAFAVFDILPTIAIDLAVPESRQGLVNAIFTAGKNPTVIAVTMLWLIGVARTLIVEHTEDQATPGPTTAGRHEL